MGLGLGLALASHPLHLVQVPSSLPGAKFLLYNVVESGVQHEGDDTGSVRHRGPDLALLLVKIVPREELLHSHGVDFRAPEAIPQIVTGALALQAQAVLPIRLENVVLFHQGTATNLKHAQKSAQSD